MFNEYVLFVFFYINRFGPLTGQGRGNDIYDEYNFVET